MEGDGFLIRDSPFIFLILIASSSDSKNTPTLGLLPVNTSMPVLSLLLIPKVSSSACGAITNTFFLIINNLLFLVIFLGYVFLFLVNNHYFYRLNF